MRYFRGEIHETGTCKKYDNRIATEADSFVFTASVLGNIFQQTYNMVDTVIVGQTLGAKALAAVGASTSVQFLVLGFCQGLCLGFNVPIGQRFGAKDEEGMHRYEYVGSVMGVVFALILTVLTEVFCGPILKALQVPSEIYDQAYQRTICRGRSRDKSQ